MDLPEELRHLFPEQRSGSNQHRALPRVFRVFRDWASSVHFRSETGTTGIPATVLGAGSASSLAIRATSGCAVRYSLPSRGLATSRTIADHRLEAPATPEVG